jgi:transcriptional regulator with GAF, ATPase, and Fis domain
MNLEFLQAVALSVANERSLVEILKRIVAGLADTPEMVLARIWLRQPGDICQNCPARSECPDQTECLHLVASDGHPLDASSPRPTRLNGKFRRFPLGIRKVGRIGATGEAILYSDVDALPAWIKDPGWAKAECVRSFAGQPLIFRGDILGVLAIFSRSVLTNADLALLRSFADNAAAAIANARAFAEVERLHRQLEAENEYLREEVRVTCSSSEIVGHSAAVQQILEKISKVAPADSSVLIQGESGTGKELVAREIHKQSKRKNKALIRVNCATVPAELFESEFFGHVKGSFTGALRDRIGRFQIADGGTLFLDEVGEIPLNLQAKLLRVLQEGEFEPVGEDRSRSVNVRIIAATNRDLQNEIEQGRFREDLYYRLSVFPIQVPPLRQHPEDIGQLAAHFLQCIAARLSVPEPPLKQRHVSELAAYSWPGNVRELENVIERALLTQQRDHLTFDLHGQAHQERSGVAAVDPIPQEAQAERGILTAKEMRALERDNLIAALEACRWKIGGPDGAAALLGVKPTTLSSQLKALRIERAR